MVRELASSVRHLVASDLARARESAAWLSASHEVEIDPELREAALPESLRVRIRLPPGAWVALARIAWWLNWCEAKETIMMTRARAGRVADRLASLAVEHRSVMAIGHGMFNQFLASELLLRGWRGPRFPPRGYWAVAQFEQSEPGRTLALFR